jgi:hypothetical protein
MRNSPSPRRKGGFGLGGGTVLIAELALGFLRKLRIAGHNRRKSATLPNGIHATSFAVKYDSSDEVESFPVDSVDILVRAPSQGQVRLIGHQQFLEQRLPFGDAQAEARRRHRFLPLDLRYLVFGNSPGCRFGN